MRDDCSSERGTAACPMAPDYKVVNSMRFASVVDKAGKPDIHLMLVAPEKDARLQKAIKSNRVMVLHQPRSGTDYGTVGFEKRAAGQILIFPKSLKSFEGTKIVGVKYELLEAKPAQKQQYHPSKRGKSPQRERKGKPGPEPPPEKVVAFSQAGPGEDDEEEEDERSRHLEQGIHHAMDMLEQ